MKLKLFKRGKEYYAAVHTGNGGISSKVASRQAKSLWFALGVFKPKNIWVSIIGKKTLN